MQRFWNRLFEQLVLIRFGQELGTDSDLAQAIANSIDAAVQLAGRFLG